MFWEFKGSLLHWGKQQLHHLRPHRFYTDFYTDSTLISTQILHWFLHRLINYYSFWNFIVYNVKFNKFLHRNEHAQRTVDSKGCRLSDFFIFDLVWPIQTMFWDFQGSLLHWGKQLHHLCPLLFDPFSKRKKKDILVQIECEVQNKDIEAN